MRRLLSLLVVALAPAAQAGAEWSCAEATYASEVCPWFGGAAADGYATPSVAMRWSSDGYQPGSAAGRWNDGIFVVVSLPRTEPPHPAAFLIDIGYEPDRLPEKARTLEPFAAILRLGDRQWRSDTPESLPPGTSEHPWPHHFGGGLHRFAFGPDLVAAMLAISDAAPLTYRDLFLGDDPAGALRFEILFRDAEGDIVSSNDIVEIDSGTCEANCRPLLSLSGFAEAYQESVEHIRK